MTWIEIATLGTTAGAVAGVLVYEFFRESSAHPPQGFYDGASSRWADMLCLCDVTQPKGGAR